MHSHAIMDLSFTRSHLYWTSKCLILRLLFLLASLVAHLCDLRSPLKLALLLRAIGLLNDALAMLHALLPGADVCVPIRPGHGA